MLQYIVKKLPVFLHISLICSIPQLAQWTEQFQLFSKTNRYLIQVPRVYAMLKAQGTVKTLAEMMDHVFAPVMHASLYPEENEALSKFLLHVSGFDSVDDESKLEVHFTERSAEEWNSADNPQ